MSSPYDSAGHLSEDAGTHMPTDDSARSAPRAPAAPRKPAVRTLQLAGTPLPERRNPSKRPTGRTAGSASPNKRTDTAPHDAARARTTRKRTPERGGRTTGRSWRTRRRRPLPPVSAIIAIIAVIAAIALIALACCRIAGLWPFAATDGAGTDNSSSSATSTEQISASEVTAALKGAGIDCTIAEQAGKLSEKDDRLGRIAQNIDAYRKDGSAVQKKLMKLAVDDPEAIDFVVGWPGSYPQKTGATYDGTVEKGQIPQLYQWDTRWGYTTYSGTSFALTGCCPTSLSMVYMGLTGKTDMTPYDLGVLAGKDGYESKNEGTIGDFLTDDATKLGLVCRKIDIDSGTLKYYLDRGYVVICNVGAGDFTDGGHYFVITGLDDQEKLTIHDPYSSVRSAKHWNIARVLNQTIALYAFTTPD